MHEAEQVTIKRYACRHIHATGHRCGSPALRGEPFCYYHHTNRRPAPNQPRPYIPPDAAFDLPALEDRPSIHLAIAEVIRRIAANQLDTRRAGLLLYALQIASANLPREPRPGKTTARTPYAEPVQPIPLVEHFHLDPTHGPLAAIVELDPEEEEEEEDDFHGPTAPARRIMARLLKGRCPTCKAAGRTTYQDDPEENPADNPTEPHILPTIQAVAEATNPGGPSFPALSERVGC